MKCIVTKLKEKINNNNLVPLNCILVHIDRSSVTLAVGASEAGCIGKILTQGVTFTNSVFSGLTEQEFPVNTFRGATVSGECDILITKASKIIRLAELNGGSNAFAHINIDSLYGNYVMKYLSINKCSGDIKALRNMTSIETCVIPKNKDNIGTYGDVSNIPISTSLYNLVLNSQNIEGDISFVSAMTAMVDFNIAYTSISGNVSALSSLTHLRDVNLSRTLVTGSISAFAGISTLRNLQLIKCNITGNLSQLVNVPALKDAYFPDSVYYTAEDATRIDTLMAANGGTQKSSGHYFYGGTLVKSY